MSVAFPRNASAPRPPFRWVSLLGASASLALAAPLLWLVYWPAERGLDVHANPVGRDFINVWAAPRLAFAGRIAEVYDRPAYVRAIGELFGAALPFHNWSYPPSALALLAPVAALPYFAALATWLVLTFTIYMIAALGPVPRRSRPAAALMLALAPTTFINAVGGQNGFLTAALFLGSLRLLPARPAQAGALLGLMSIKPHLALIAPVLLAAVRAWRALAAAAAVALALAAVSVLLFGLEPWRAYLTDTSRYTVGALEQFKGFFRLMMGSVYTSLRTSGVDGGEAWVAQAAVGVATLGAATTAFRRTSNPLLRVQIAVTAAPLLTPYIFFYDLTALSAVLVWRLLDDGPGRPPLGVKVLYGVAWLSPCALFFLNIFEIGAAAPLLGAVFAATVLEAFGWRSREDSNFRPSV